MEELVQNRSGKPSDDGRAKDNSQRGGDGERELKSGKMIEGQEGGSPVINLMMFARSPRAELRLEVMRQLLAALSESVGQFVEQNDRRRTPIGFNWVVPEAPAVTQMLSGCEAILRLVKPILTEAAASQGEVLVQAYAKALKPAMREIKSFLVENSRSLGVPEGRLKAVVARLSKYERVLTALASELTNICAAFAEQKAGQAQAG